MPYCQPPDLETRASAVDTAFAEATSARMQALESEQGPFSVLSGSSLVFSAPHEHEHWREGSAKQAEQGTRELALALARQFGASALATSGPQTGDPNWDEGHAYVKHAISLARGGALVDLHMMRPRGFEVCLGLGPDHEFTRFLWQPLVDELLAADVRVSLNWPFGSRGRTVVAQAAAAGVPGIQVEISFGAFAGKSQARACVVSALICASETWSTRVSGGLLS